MVAKSLEIGDLVWAKMKGYPPWPGKIMEPPAEAKSSKVKKSQHYVFFYGSENHAWIADENIVLHNDKLVDEYVNKRRPSVYLSAVEMIMSYSKNSSKYQKQLETSSRLSSSKEETPPKNRSHHMNSVARKGEIKKKIYVKKSVGNKTMVRKRTFSSDHNGEGGDDYSPSKMLRCDDYSSKMLREDDGYTNLLSNVPPNITYSDSVHQTSRFDKTGYKELVPRAQFDFNSKNLSLANRNIKPTTKKIGFLGLGNIGRAIVKNLLQSGHSVIVWDAEPEKRSPFVDIGAQEAPTPSDVVSNSDITFSCVSGLEAAKTLFFENFGGLKGFEKCEEGKKGYVEMTSIDATTSQSISEAIASRGGRYLEAQFVGSIQDAEEGALILLSAGDKTLFDDCKSCFEAISQKTKFMGSNVGDASNINIIHSSLLGIVCAAVAESLALSERVGLKGDDFLDILNYGILDSKLIAEKGQCMIKSEYTTNTPLKHIQNNIHCGLMLGHVYRQPLPITAATSEVYKHCKLLRYGDHDISAVYEGTKR